MDLLIISNLSKPSSNKCSLLLIMSNASLKDKKSKCLVPLNGYFKKWGKTLLFIEEKSCIPYSITPFLSCDKTPQLKKDFTILSNSSSFFNIVILYLKLTFLLNFALLLL